MRRREVVASEYKPEVLAQISARWFAGGGGRNNFTAHVKPHRDRIDHYLEIGTFAGGSLFWVFEQLQPKAAIAIDHYPADRKRDAKHNAKIGDAMDQLWREHYPGIHGQLIREPSEQVLPVLLAKIQDGELPAFDFAYIDGSHHGADVFFDAALASRMVRPGGFLIFDDFSVARRGNIQCLRYAIDGFVRTHADEYELLFANIQCGLRRRMARRCDVGEVPGVAPSVLDPGEYDHPRRAALRNDTGGGIVG